MTLPVAEPPSRCLMRLSAATATWVDASPIRCTAPDVRNDGVRGRSGRVIPQWGGGRGAHDGTFGEQRAVPESDVPDDDRRSGDLGDRANRSSTATVAGLLLT